MAANNIYNPETGIYGYNVPGADLPSGFQNIPASQPSAGSSVGGAIQDNNTSTSGGAVNPADKYNINTTNLAGATPLSLPSTAPTGNPAAAVIATSQAGVDAQKQAEATVAKETASLQPIQDQRNSILDKIKGYVGLETTAQNTALTDNSAIDPYRKDLADINKTIADTTVAYRGEKDAISGNGSITKEGQQSLLSNVETKYGRQLADLAIRQSAANQNITALQTAADRKLQLTLAPIQTEISYYKDFLLNNLDNLTTQEKDKINMIIAEKNNVITRETAQQAIGNEAIKTAIANGVQIPDQVVAQIQQNPGQAYSILAANRINLAKPEKLTDALGNEYFAQPGSKNPIPTLGGNTITGPGPSGTPNASTVGTGPNKLSFDQYGLLANTDFNPSNQIDSLAQKYIDTYLKSGAIPTSSTLGRAIKPGAMAQIDSRARDLYFKATGTPLPNPEVIKANQDILAKNLQLANNLKVQEQTVSANVDFSLANMKANDLNSASFKPLSSAINTIEDMFNDPATGQLIAQNTTIQNELGSLLAVKNASGTTVYDKLSSAGIITSSDSPAQVKAKVSALLTEASNFADSLKSANAGIYQQIDPLMQDANNPLRQQRINSTFVENALNKTGASYQDVVSRTPSGQIPVVDKQGNVGYILPTEFDPSKYTKL